MIFAAFDSKLNFRLFTNPSTLFRHQPGLVSLPVTRTLFRYYRFTRPPPADPHQSLSERGSAREAPYRKSRARAHQVQGDCALRARRQKHGPWSSWTPENYLCQTSKNVRRSRFIPCSHYFGMGYQILEWLLRTTTLWTARHRRI